MRYGDFLKENGTIGFVAPSFGCASEPYKTAFVRALDKFDKMGYKASLGPNVFKDCGIGISNTPSECGRELTEWYLSRDNDVLISCGGGELMCETLDHIDFEAIKNARPKWYMGYSDNTNFTFLSAILCDTASIYGPCASTVGMDVWHDSLRDAFDLLEGKKNSFKGYDKWEIESLRSETNQTPLYNTTEESNIVIFKGNSHSTANSDINTSNNNVENNTGNNVENNTGNNAENNIENNAGNNAENNAYDEVKISGRLLGGCLDILIMLCGTKYDKVGEFLEKYKDDGFIWFVEACDLSMLSIRRALWQLKEASWFKYCNGIMVGRPLHYGEEIMSVNQYNAVTDILSDLNVPIIMDMDIGHLPPMIPLVVGSLASLEVKAGKYSIEMKMC